MKTIHILALLMTVGAATAYAAIAPGSACGPALQIKDAQLRATFAQFDHAPASAELCALYRARDTASN